MTPTHQTAKRRLRNAISTYVAAICLITACHAEPTTIRIRFANGRTGKPLHLKSYEHGEGGDLAGKYHVDKIDGDSMIVTFNDTSTFAFRSGAFDPCDAPGKHQPAPRYSLQEVVQQGIVSPNYCGGTHATPKPGELLIYSRHEHWWEITGRVAKGLLICG